MTHLPPEKKQADREPVILLCLSDAPSTKRVIKAAGRYRMNTGCTGIAVSAGIEPEASPALREHIAAAKEYGFEVHMIESDDVAGAIAEFAKKIHATDVFLGNTASPVFALPRRSISDQLLGRLPGADLHVIPDQLSSPIAVIQKRRGTSFPDLNSLAIVAVIMLAATLISYWFYQSRFSNANIITVYILAVLAASLLTSNRGYGMLAAGLYILLFNFLFLEPRFTFLVYDSGYLMTYFVSVIAALLTGSLASRVQNIALRSAENAYQAKVLLDTSNQLEQAENADEMIRITCMQLIRLLNRSILFYRMEQEEEDPAFYPFERGTVTRIKIKEEYKAALWTKENRHHSGAYTSMYPECRFQYLSVHTDAMFYGVIGIDMNGKPFTEIETTILHSIVLEFTMALDNERMRREQRAAMITTEKERMRAGLLRSISHDLRTPLTSVYGNAANLVENGMMMSEEDKQAVYSDIMTNSQWLVEQMTNILSMTKLESESAISTTIENVEDVIDESIRHCTPDDSHHIEVNLPEEALFAEMNTGLIMQVIVNLLNNALKYTPPGTKITVEAERQGARIHIRVKDLGPGIPDEEKKHVFDLFYTGTHNLPDSYRSMGIGLNLCSEIVKAHGSTITVTDNNPCGAVFSFSLAAR